VAIEIYLLILGVWLAQAYKMIVRQDLKLREMVSTSVVSSSVD